VSDKIDEILVTCKDLKVNIAEIDERLTSLDQSVEIAAITEKVEGIEKQIRDTLQQNEDILLYNRRSSEANERIEAALIAIKQGMLDDFSTLESHMTFFEANMSESHRQFSQEQSTFIEAVMIMIKDIKSLVDDVIRMLSSFKMECISSAISAIKGESTILMSIDNLEGCIRKLNSLELSYTGFRNLFDNFCSVIPVLKDQANSLSGSANLFQKSVAEIIEKDKSATTLKNVGWAAITANMIKSFFTGG